MTEDDIKYLLGEINGKLDSIKDRLDKMNGSILRHEDRINTLESFKDNLEGRMSIISALGGFIGGIVTVVFNWLLHKNV